MSESVEEARNQRFHDEKRAAKEYRTDAQRDRDRILHASAFGRLAGVTQVIPPGDEGHLLHNRMTHSVKVAQVARRIAELRLQEQAEICAAVGGVDPDVVEAAALAHDLGHPPFGHIAEKALKESIETQRILTDAFEGNAQTFRIVTKLARRAPEYEGLNLTRATLNAILKYPWTRATGGNKREKKWSVYETEVAEFNWTRRLPILERHDHRKTAEAELMDWADDIAYSVHDIEDFYRVGAIPLHRLAKRHNNSSEEPELKAFYDGAADRRHRAELDTSGRPSRAELEEAFEDIRQMFPITPYTGRATERGELRAMSKSMIGRFVRAIRLRVPDSPDTDFVDIDEKEAATVTMLKELTWYYVINNPALATQQYGQQQMIKKLFEVFSRAAADPEELKIFPGATREILMRLHEEPVKSASERHRSRTVVDVLAGMTEQQILRMYLRLMGITPGSALDRVY